ncbi:MAG: hypothetical protein RIR25_1709 [Verrucomicrobiota bacterium]
MRADGCVRLDGVLLFSVVVNDVLVCAPSSTSKLFALLIRTGLILIAACSRIVRPLCSPRIAFRTRIGEGNQTHCYS